RRGRKQRRAASSLAGSAAADGKPQGASPLSVAGPPSRPRANRWRRAGRQRARRWGAAIFKALHGERFARLRVAGPEGSERPKIRPQIWPESWPEIWSETWPETWPETWEGGRTFGAKGWGRGGKAICLGLTLFLRSTAQAVFGGDGA